MSGTARRRARERKVIARSFGLKKIFVAPPGFWSLSRVVTPEADWEFAQFRNALDGIMLDVFRKTFALSGDAVLAHRAALEEMGRWMDPMISAARFRVDCYVAAPVAPHSVFYGKV